MTSKQPKITIGKHSGFCFGVKRAYDLTYTCPVGNLDISRKKNTVKLNGAISTISDGVNSKDCSDVYILGKLVHNNDVCKDLHKRGIKEIKSLADIKEGTVIFTAHGVGPELYEKATAKGLKIIDTTCPKVMKAQRIAKKFAEKNCVVLVFGDKNHKEVKSIFEWSEKKTKIISSLKEVKKIKINKTKKYCLISQTTQNVVEFKKIIVYLENNLKNFIYFNTICPSTDDRQKEVRQLAKKNDAVIVIGGSDSANSRMLYDIAKSINKKTYFIENAKQLKKNWFSDIKRIAISAGASTPEWVIDEVVDKIKMQDPVETH